MLQLRVAWLKVGLNSKGTNGDGFARGVRTLSVVMREVSGLDRLIQIIILPTPPQLWRAITCRSTSPGSKIRPLLRNAKRRSAKSSNDRRPSFRMWMAAPIFTWRDQKTISQHFRYLGNCTSQSNGLQFQG